MAKPVEIAIFILRDADALGLRLEETNGKVRIKDMSLPGISGLLPMDHIICSSLESMLNEFLESKSRSLTLYVSLNNPSTRALSENSPRDRQFVSKADQLCKKNKFMEAAATYGIIEEDDPLVLANRSSALQLSKRIDEASVVANRIIQQWPKWEMGYVRKAACQFEHNDLHSAIRTIALGLRQLPARPSLLWRARTVVPELETEVTCMGDTLDTIISVYRSQEQILKIFNRCTDINGSGLRATESLNPLLPENSVALEVNGVLAQSTRFSELARYFTRPELQVIVVIWKVPTMDSTNDPSNGIIQSQPKESSQHTEVESAPNQPSSPELDEAQIMQKLAATPTSQNLVIVFGAGYPACNGDFFPQGTRNEKPWFENEHGICLSYEQAESGTCSWVIGDPSIGSVYYVLRPGHDLRGEDFGHWLPSSPEFSPPPSFSGVGDKVQPLKRLTTWIKDQRPNDISLNGFKTMIPHLLQLKGHAVRLMEGGWNAEALVVLNLVLDQTLALAVGDDRCPSDKLARIAQDARLLKKEAQDNINSDKVRQSHMDISILTNGVVFSTFDDEQDQVLVKVIDNHLSISKVEGKEKNGRTQQRPWFSNLFGCSRPGPPPEHPLRRSTANNLWRREDIKLNFSAIGGRSKLIISNISLNKTWELLSTDDALAKSLEAWRQVDKAESDNSHNLSIDWL